MSTDTVLDIFEKPGVPYSVTADAYSTSSIGAAAPPVETAAVVNPHCGDGLPAPLNQPALAFSGTIPAQSYVEDIAITPLDISGYWTGGQAPRTYSVFSGTLPSGLTLDSATGIVSGTPPTPAAATPIVFRATDSLGAVANSGSVNFTITAAGSVAFDAVVKNALFTMSNGDRSVASTSNSSGASAISDNAYSTGKRYFEYVQTAGGEQSGGVAITNVATATAINQASGQVSGSWAWQQSGVRRNNSSSTVWGSVVAQVNGDVVMLAVDFDNNKMWAGKNGVWGNSSDPAAGTNPMFNVAFGTCRLQLNLYGAAAPSTPIQATGNFLLANCVYTPPVGFLAWDA